MEVHLVLAAVLTAACVWSSARLALMTRQNMDLLKTIVFGPNAINDHRFVWEEITPDNLEEQPTVIQEKIVGDEVVYTALGARWSDFRKYRVAGCAHIFRAEGVCDTCGDDQTEVTT